MLKADLLTMTGTKSGTINLPKEIFAAKVKPVLMAQAVRVYLANQRRARAKAKNRSEITGSRRKIWRQKGTGRARHSDRYAPIFVGGGVTHGPTGRENYQLRMSKKMKKKALFSDLTSKFKSGETLVVQGFEKLEPKTREMAKVIKNIKIRGSKPSQKNSKLKITLILPGVLDNLMRAGSNLSNLELIQAGQLNTYKVLSGGTLVFMKESVAKLEEVFLGSRNKKLTVQSQKIKDKSK